MASASTLLHLSSNLFNTNNLPRIFLPTKQPPISPPSSMIISTAKTVSMAQLSLHCCAAGPAARPRHAIISNHSRTTHQLEPTLFFEPAEESDPLKIGIVGFGNFGQFIAKGLKRQGHTVLASSRSDYSDYCEKQGIKFLPSLDAMCEEQPDVVLVCSSILSTESVVRAIPIHKLSPDTVFVDVLSVKQFPRNLFLEVLPAEFGIVCTHPMFGPESGKNGWAGLPFVYDEVRIAKNSRQARISHQFLNIFHNEGCRMVEMSCEEHDRHAAGSQFITHTIGRILSQLNLESTPINTKGYETLLQLTENAVSDSFDLYYGLFMYNVNASEQIENLDRAFETVKQKLFGRLHDILRKQIVERVPMQGTGRRMKEANATPYFLPGCEGTNDIPSFTLPPPLPSPPPRAREADEVKICRPAKIRAPSFR